MGHQLVTKEIKVDPAIRLAASGATENATVKPTGSFQIGDWEGQMETGVHGVAHGC
jgi:hypothetical protein